MSVDNFDTDKFQSRRRLVDSGSIFTVSIFVAVVTVVFVWVLGLGMHRTLFVNSLLSVSILSAAFLLFIVSGLYRGIKLKDGVGKVTDKFRSRNFDLGGVGDVSGCFDGEGVLSWLAGALLAILLIWIFGNVLWFLILVFIAMLYWIFFRALRLIFKKSYLCKGNWVKSLGYGLYYTILYNFWIYGIIMGAHYFINKV
jgi:hypothetical protein